MIKKLSLSLLIFIFAYGYHFRIAIPREWEPISIEAIEGFLKSENNGPSHELIADLITEFGVSFKPTEDNIQKLRKLNASDQIINAILPDILYVTFNAEPTGAIIKITDKDGNHIKREGIIGKTFAAETQNQISWRRGFDEQDRLTKLIDPAGRETRFEYSTTPKGTLQVTKVPPEGSRVVWDYDKRGRLSNMTDGAGNVAYGYDDLGRLNHIQREKGPAVSYGYDVQDRIVSLRVGDFYELDYTYDFLGRLESINTPAGTITYEYLTGQGLLVRTLPNGVQTIWKYRPDGKLDSISHAYKDNSLIAKYTYTYRFDGLISKINEWTTKGEKTLSYKYDTVQRLVSCTNSIEGETVFAYDQLGNRTSKKHNDGQGSAHTYDWAGRIITYKDENCVHDASGNLTSYYKSPDTKNTIKYSCSNLLKEANTVEYRYDGFGYLTIRKNKGLETNYISDPLSKEWKPIMAKEGDDKKTFYIWEGKYPLVTIKNGEARFFLQDHLGSVRFVVNKEAKIVNQLDYSPFGMSNKRLDADSLQFGFAGLILDSKSQLYLTRARGYDPRIGCFLQIDPQHRVPFGSQKDFSSYAYCGNDPINYVDRTGFAPEPVRPGPGGFGGLGVGGYDGFGGGYFGGLGAGGSNSPLGIGNPLNPLYNNVPLFNKLPKWSKGATKDALKAAEILKGNKFAKGFGKALGYVDKLDSIEFLPLFVIDFGVDIAKDALVKSWAGPAGAPLSVLEWSINKMSGIEDFNREFIRVLTPVEVNHALLKEAQSLERRLSSGDPRVMRSSGGGIMEVESPKLPSTVGGVYLGGAGKVLDGIGLLEGIALDSNNNLILLSKSGDEINLPPLRLDDVVTVFRSVYIHGEGPTVTIDPNPKNPEGSAMIIRHGKATENTYVGWILYQADRIMKGYTLGVDNITTKDVTSTVPGYEEVLDTLYFGDDTPEKSRKGGHWERFWIVPSYARRYNAVHSNLTLFDVPLKVKTQVMKWEKGKLVDDPKGKSSAGAMKFIKWFTKQYEAISREQYLTPPPETGIDKPVPVFSELRRIALMTAIAEKLRDQGTPMPFWMRNYKVRTVSFDKTTPALTITRSKGNVRAKVFGGVALSPESKDVKQFTHASDLQQLTKIERKHATKILIRATTLSKTVRISVSPTKPLKLHKIQVGDDAYHALPIPGSDTLALAPCLLEEIDMIVPIEGGHEIRLSRNYHSFFEPSGSWGKGWTLNLPWLEEVKVPITRKGSQVQYRMEYELLTPLNSIYTRFSRVKKVPALNNSQLQTPDKECGFFGLADGAPTFLTVPTRKLLRKDGGVWHFTRAGDLAAIEKNGFRTVYLRNHEGSVSQIVGLLGSQKMGAIDLSYDDRGRLVRATGKNNHGEQKIGYEYDSAGKLSYVVSDQGKLGYQYTGPWVTSMTWQDFSVTNDENLKQDKTLRSFEYNGNGQLIAETGEDGQRITYNITSCPQGNFLTVTNPGEKTASETILYDAAYRPVEARYDNGTQATWTYSDNGENVLSIKYPEGGNIKIIESADKRRQTIEAPDMPVLTKEYDEAGRLTAITKNGQNIIRQHWYPGGKLQTIENDNCAASPQYNQDGLITSVILSRPGEKEQLKHWQKTEMDIAGRPVEITDYRGLHMVANYDDKGNIKQVVTERDGKNFGFDISRDDEGRIQTVNSSCGKRQFTYDENGAVESVTLKKPGREGPDEQSVLKFASGQLISAKQFDGGEVAISYYGEGPHENLPEQITCANGLNLNYHYDSSNNLEAVIIGNQSQIALDYDTKGRIIGYTCCSVRN